MKIRYVNISLLEIISSIVLGLIVVVFLTRDKVAFENLALGEGTSSYFAKDENYSIHIGRLRHKDADNLLEGWKNRGERNVMFVLGNSQTHGINNMKPGEMSYNHMLFNDYQKASVDVLSLSIPNANLQEFLLSFDYWKRKLPIKRLVIPLFMDDLRDDGIREYYFGLFKDTEFAIESEAEVALTINRSIAEFTPTKQKGEKEIDPNMKALDLTVQQRSEEYINDRLNAAFTSWENRPTLRGKIFHNLYLLRNTVLGINAQTERKMIPARLKRNMEALEEILVIADKSNIQVLLYVPPLRNDVSPPYNAEEYADIKNQFSDIANQFHNTTFVNLEDIVPGEYWGVKEATNFSRDFEYDFMHFQFEGHRLLYDQLTISLDKMPKI